MHLTPQLAGELEEHGPQLVCYREGIDGDGVRGQLVNQVNKTGGRAAPSLTCSRTVVATITRPQKSLALILARGVAANLSVPISVLDADGNLVFFNEAAEEMHGITFAEAGELSASDWPDVLSTSVPLEELPVGVALFERRPVHTIVDFTGADGVPRRVSVTAFPLMGREDELYGAFAIFWHL